MDSPRSPIRNPQSSFTLIELLVTVVILATGIVVVMRAFNTSLVALDESQNALQTAWVIRNCVAEVRIDAAEDGRITPGRASGRVERPTVDSLWEIEKEPVAAEGGGGTNGALYRVTVATWPENVDRRYSAATYIRCRQ